MRDTAATRQANSRLMVGVALVAIAILVTWRARNPERTLRLAGATMGTTYAVRLVVGPSGSADSAFVHDSIQAILDRFDAIASTYDPESELSRFNRRADTARVATSPWLTAVFAVAQRVSAQTGGALDVTVGPLVNAWGFGPEVVAADHVPDSQLIDSLRRYVGYSQLSIEEAGAVGKRNALVTADLSAVAKGYGVDLIASTLSTLGYERFLIEIGGEVVGRGVRADGEPWRVGIENPDPAGRSLGLIIDVVDQATATSGDYRNFVTIGGERYSHVIDPRTGRPLPFRPSAVTVVHTSAAEADAWATALFVLGPEEGLAVAEREGLAVLFQLYESDQLVLRRSSAFAGNVRQRDPGS